jgi:hypothetical protein
MLFLIYSIYADSLGFVRKNIILVLPFVLNELFKLIVDNFTGTIFGVVFRLASMLLIPCLIDIYIVLYVFKSENIVNPSVQISSVVKKYYRRFVLLYFLGYILACVAVFPSLAMYINIAEMANVDPNSAVVYSFLTVFGFLVFIVAGLGLRILIYKNIKTMVALKESFAEVQKDLYFYFFVFLFGVVLTTYPSFITFFNFSFIYFLPIAEFHSYIVNDFIRVALLSFLSVWFSVALTYAFLEKNKKTRYAS